MAEFDLARQKEKRVSYWVQCAACKDARRVANIVDLIQQNTDPQGNLVCPKCRAATGYFEAKSALQETGAVWERCIKAVIPLETDFETSTPYVFLTAPSPTGEPHGVHFNYYKDTRASGGRLKHGHGPGGAPVLNCDELMQLLEKLGDIGFIKPEQLIAVAERIRH
jgi:hypothetical protein